MAAPSYTHDLTDWIADSDTTAWGELTGAAAGGAPDEADTESALQGTNTVSQAMNTTSLCSMARILGTPVTFSSGQVALVWHGHGVATALQTYANNGLRIAKATTLADWGSYTVGGSDVPPMPYGKWVNNAVDFSLTPDATNGTAPTGGTNIYGIGSMAHQTQTVAKGQPHVCDIIRYGRAEARFAGGSLADGYATFDGFAALNDAPTARWGLIQSSQGGYLWKGLMTIGHGAACEFVDSNKNILIQDCRKVSSTFNHIDIKTNGTIVNWSNISFQNLSPSTNASKGSLAVSTDTVTVTMNGCQFTDMSTFTLRSTCTIGTTTFRRCETVTGNGATFNQCAFNNSPSASSVVVADLAKLNGCSFISDGSNHAVELTSIGAGSMTWNCTGTGYDTGSTGSPVTPTNTGNEMIYVNVASGTLTISVAAGATVPSIRSAGATVNVSSGSVTVKVRAVDEGGSPVSGARLFLEASSGGPFPSYASVTIANSGTTATVTHTSHGMATNDKVCIRGASHNQNNGVFTITRIDANSYSYTMASAPGSSPTGTITSTFVALSDVSDGTGFNTTSVSRVYPSDQPVVGRIRKSTSAPYYKNAPISGTISSASGGTFTGVLISDD